MTRGTFSSFAQRYLRFREICFLVKELFLELTLLLNVCCFTDNFLVSLQELLLLFMLSVFLITSLVKWSKRLRVVVTLELCTIMILGNLFFLFIGITFVMFSLFVFFVGEALILMRALFSLVQLVGKRASHLSLY